MKLRLLFAFMPILLSGYFVRAQTLVQVENMQKAPSCYGIMKIDVPIQIDGRDDEKVWNLTPWTEEFTDIEGDVKSKPPYTTKIKMLWDNEHFYIYARMEEPHVWGRLTQRDTIIYHDNDFEIFIKPFEQQSFYYEIEVNPLNTILDLIMPKPYRLGGDALMHWDVKNLKSAIHVEGTLNNANDRDQYWAVEMAIPFKSLTTFSSKAAPNVNDYWRINFSRVQWQHEVHHGEYARKVKDGKLLPEENWVWSPIGVINMHYPERWGYVKFIDSLQEVSLPKSYRAEKMAWNIFYLQQLYKQEHKYFADSIEELEEGRHLLAKDADDLCCEIFINSYKAGYVLEVKDLESHFTVILDNFGHYRINYE
ncbi:carbohydrate-binding family 9-like protein [Sphingobacterium sp. DN00404]|uniref:Carbohydrate-binding family 9-like protein n=1 Tax=Sphingobacterium micropteri TaxID=2763501 RepID=A0ABR7YRN4_9SPHI|nr:carbohydrate-binding family 9-like protein [Sphingobacterium micropteri]MBD1433991.1 carbohydrate-binding family 9-like protein [Sphingobacterium micropteri]